MLNVNYTLFNMASRFALAVPMDLANFVVTNFFAAAALVFFNAAAVLGLPLAATTFFFGAALVLGLALALGLGLVPAFLPLAALALIKSST